MMLLSYFLNHSFNSLWLNIQSILKYAKVVEETD